MKTIPRTGQASEQTIVVGPANRISFADQRMPSVLATPWLIAHLEYAARDAIAPCLEEHERSVGTFVEVEHLAPAPEGFTVTCRARVILVDGPVVTFQVEATASRDGSTASVRRRAHEAKPVLFRVGNGSAWRSRSDSSRNPTASPE
jgi:fluoroacetyl-CoA thioesterase